MTHPQLFDGLDELNEHAENAPEIYEGKIFGKRDYDNGEEEWEQFPYRKSKWIENGGMIGDVSKKRYEDIGFGEALDAISAAFSAHGVEPKGYLQYSDTGHRLIGYADIPAAKAEVVDGDVIDLGLQFSIGQSGFHGIHYMMWPGCGPSAATA